MAPPGQRTFVPVPTTVGIQSLIARPEGEAVVSHQPMTSRRVREAYRKRTAAAPPTEEELRRQRLVAATEKKEKEKEKASAKARVAREKKAEREKAEREEKKRKGLPVVEVTASQSTIAGFFRGGVLERRREVGGVDLVKPLPLAAVVEDKDKENQDQEPPEKKQKLEEGERKPVQKAPTKKKIFGRNIPFKGRVDAVRPVGHNQQRPSISPSKKQPIDLVEHDEENQRPPPRPFSKPETKSPDPPAKKRLRSTPVAKVAARDTSDCSQPDRDAHKLGGRGHAGDFGRDIVREPKLAEKRSTPARDGAPSVDKASNMRSESEPATFSKPRTIANPPLVPTVAPTKMPPSERSRSEPVSVANSPPQRRPLPPPLYNRERGLSTPAPNPTTARPPAADASGSGTRNPQRPATSATYQNNRPTMSPAIVPTEVSFAASPRTQHPQRLSARPPTTLPAVPPQRPHVAYLKRSPKSRAPPITAASYGYLPAAQPQGPPKHAAAGPAFVRPVRAPYSPIVPAFKPTAVSTGSTTFQRPKFLSKNANPSTPANPGVHTAGPGVGMELPLSTQRFLEIHLDSVLPSPSQEERELQECSAAPPTRPAFVSPRPVMTPRPQPPQFKSRPPVPLFSRTPVPKPDPAPRQSLSVKPIRLQAVAQMDDQMPFLSTQDLTFSSQDIREVEDSDTPSKPPPKPPVGPRPSPLSKNIPSLVQANPPRSGLSSMAKGPPRNVPAQRTSIQPVTLPSSAVQAGVPPRTLPSVDKGPDMKGLPQQGPPTDVSNPPLSPFGSCSERPRFFNTQESVDPQDYMNLVAENIRLCHGLAEERQHQQDKGESGGGDQGAGALLSQETDYGDLGFDADDFMDL